MPATCPRPCREVTSPPESVVPRPIGRFVGRRRELDEVLARLDAGGRVCVVGPPGIGKTRLVQEAARRRRGLRVVDELGPSDPIPEAPLLVATAVAPRDGLATVALGPLEPERAVELFIDRAARLDPDVGRSDAVLELVVGLGCHPLAITLAAGLAAVLTVEELARIEVGELLAVSLERLDPGSRRALELCGSVPGGLSTVEAARILGSPGPLASLERGGLLIAERRGAETRLRVPRMVTATLAPGWLFDEDAQRSVDPAGREIEVGRRAAPRRILALLLRVRLDRPGAAVERSALVDAGWPGEWVHPDAAAARVHTAIRTLRRLGLEALIETVGDGYRLRPDAPIGLRSADGGARFQELSAAPRLGHR